MNESIGEYAVKAETFEGNTLVLRRGFSSQEDAEDHPVKMTLWKRVWVETVGPPLAREIVEPELPPFPWSIECSGSADIRGQHHLYLVDANGRKLAAIWGRDNVKRLTAEHIARAVNICTSQVEA